MRVAILTDIIPIDLLMWWAEQSNYDLMLGWELSPRSKKNRAWIGIPFVRFADGRTEALESI